MIRRRLVTIPRTILLWVILSVSLPGLLIVVAAVDLVRRLITGKPWLATRLLVMAWVYCGAEVVVMAAAVADFRPAEVAGEKIKKSDDPQGAPVVRLVRNPDVLAGLAAARPAGQVVVGFAAETGDARAGVLEHARRKLEHKGCDLLVVNDVSGGQAFGSERNRVTLLDRNGGELSLPEGTKNDVAERVWDAVVSLRGASGNVVEPVHDGATGSAGDGATPTGAHGAARISLQ